MQNWEQWIEKNKDNIEHVAGYEEQFVNTILRHIPEITPDDLSAQYQFTDFKGKNRYIDFIIKNEAKGYLLPIELDGFWKVKTYGDFSDMLDRQNALVAKFGVLLRYTNAQMKYEAPKIMTDIKRALKLQSEHKGLEEFNKNTKEQVIQELKSELERLQTEAKAKGANTNSSSELAQLSSAIKELQNRFEDLSVKNTQPISQTPIQTPFTTPSPNLKSGSFKLSNAHMALLTIIVILVFALGIVFLAKNKHASEEGVYGTNASEDYSEPDTYQQQSGQAIDEGDSTFDDTSVVNDAVTNAQPVREFTSGFESAQLNENQTEFAGSTRTDSIQSSDAQGYIGESKVVCGQVAQLKDFSKGTYLNMGRSYPNQDLTIVVWSSDMRNLGNLQSYVGQNMCIYGEITAYKGVPQINLVSASQISD